MVGDNFVLWMKCNYDAYIVVCDDKYYFAMKYNVYDEKLLMGY